MLIVTEMSPMFLISFGAISAISTW